MQTKLLDGVVPPPRVDVVPVGGPACAHAPGSAGAAHDACDGVGLATVPDAEGAVEGGGEEG
jgi:hypothetical protein